MQIEDNRIKNHNWQKATSWLFTSVAEDLNSGRPRTNPASGQSGTRTRKARPTRWPLGHAASVKQWQVYDLMNARPFESRLRSVKVGKYYKIKASLSSSC